MKKNFQTLRLLLLISVFCTQVSVSLAQKETLPEMKMPDIPGKPTITKGWVGQFVYELKFNDSTGMGKGKNRKYCHVIINRINSGYIEFPTEVRGAIRVNQPDKYNKDRYESWIRSGSSNCWSRHDETDTIIEPSATMLSEVPIGSIEKYSRYTSDTGWVKGWLSYTDLQIDYTTGKYSFAIPVVEYELEGDETLVNITYTPAKKENKPRKEKKRHGLRNISYLQFGDWDMLEGTFTEGQKEIIFRERIPITLQLSAVQGVTTVKSPAKKGFIDFYLVLKKLPLAVDDKNNKSAATTKPVITEKQSTAKANEENVPPENNTKKKTGLGGLKNKINKVIRNN